MRTIGSISIGLYYATWLWFFLIGRQIFHVVFSSTFLASRYSPMGSKGGVDLIFNQTSGIALNPDV